MNSTNKVVLKIDWATHEAAKFACVNWHYSKKIATSKLLKLGVWEDGVFTGVIIFGVGTSATLHHQFNIKSTEVCELVRVALKKHETPVSRMIAIALRFLHGNAPLLRVVVSFADPSEGHHGGIYQATNWIYTGKSAVTTEYFYNGIWRHVTRVYKMLKPESIRKLQSRKKPGKYRYLMPLDDAMREQIAPLAKPYPKRAKSIVADAPTIHVGEGGSVPTLALHITTGPKEANL